MFLLFKEIEIIKIIMTIALHKKTFQVSKARKQFIKSSITVDLLREMLESTRFRRQHSL